jgi:hypothetical protein
MVKTCKRIVYFLRYISPQLNYVLSQINPDYTNIISSKTESAGEVMLRIRVCVTNIMGSEFDDWIYWHLFTITVSQNSSRRSR